MFRGIVIQVDAATMDITGDGDPRQSDNIRDCRKAEQETGAIVIPWLRKI